MHSAIERLPELINGNAPLVARGRFLSTVFLVEVGLAQYYVSVDKGRIAGVERGPLLSRSCSFSVRASEDSWQRFWEHMPAPGYHDLLAMFKRGDAKIEGDLREVVARIDTTRCPLYLLTGEYDFSCTPEDTLRTARNIPGARVTTMKELGHFPMSENPAQFRRYILPVLDEIRVQPESSS